MAKDASARAKKNTANDNKKGSNNVGTNLNRKESKFVAFFKKLFKKIGDGFRRLKSELKKVTWPSFKDVMKQTGVVLLVTFIFLVIVGCFDLGLTEILKLLVG